MWCNQAKWVETCKYWFDKMEPNEADNFIVFYCFLQPFNCSYLWKQLANFNGSYRNDQGRSQPHSPRWARVPLSLFSSNFHHFFKFFIKHSSFLFSIRPSRWTSHPPKKILAAPLEMMYPYQKEWKFELDRLQTHFASSHHILDLKTPKCNYIVCKITPR